MVRRRIKSQPLIGEQNYNQSDILQNIGGLENVAALLQNEGIQEDIDLTGTAQLLDAPENFEFPQVPRNPQLFEDQMGVDDVPGIPEGIELLGDLARSEAGEDALEQVGDPEPPAVLPQLEGGGLQDPLEFIRMRIQEEPELAQYLPEETRQMLESSQPEPQKAFVPQETEEIVQEQIPETGVLDTIGSAFSDYFDPSKRQEMSESNRELFDRNKREEDVVEEPPSELPPIEEPSAQLPPAVEALPEQGTGQQVSEEDIPSEGLGAVAGSVEAAQSNEALVRNVENILHMKEGDVPKEVWEHIQLTEKVLTEQEENLNEMEREYKQKIERGELSTFDKVAIGIAIAIPVIMGLMYGKGAFFSSLGGAAKGFSEALIREQDSDTKTLGKIGEIQEEKKSISEKRANIQLEFLKNIENPEVRKLYKNYDVINTVEGVNGEHEITIGKDAMVFGDSIGLSAGDEDGALWFDTNQVRDDDDVKNFKSAVKDGKVAVSEMREVNSNIDDFMDIMTVIREQKPNAYSAMIQAIQPSENNWLSFGSSLVPDSLKTLKINVVDENGKAQTVQALPLLEQKVAALQDSYRRRYLEQNQLTKHFTQHWQSIFPDPSSISAWLKSDYNTMVQQAQNFKNLLNKKTIETLSGAGFLREPLEKLFPISGNDILRSTSIDMEDIKSSPEKYRSKVKK